MRISIEPIVQQLNVHTEDTDLIQVRVYGRVDRKYNLAIDCNGITIARIGPLLSVPKIEVE